MALPDALIAAFETLVPFVMTEGKKFIGNLINGINNEFPKMLETGTNAVVEFINGLFAEGNISSLMMSAGTMMIDFVTAIYDKIPLILESAYKIISALVSGLIANLPQIIQTGVELLLKFLAGFTSAKYKIAEKISEIYRDIKTKFNWNLHQEN